MKLTEPFKYNKPNSLTDWGHGDIKLKHKHKSDFNSEVKEYKLSKKELEIYLKGLGKRPICLRKG